MKILEYDDVDPLGVLQLNLLSLGYALTPEKVSLIRSLDARPFPFFALYVIEDGIVAGQVGIYRLPMITVNGPEEVGGICAMCIHPAFSRQGIATRLLDEAHTRMRSAGLRFSTLGTTRHQGAYTLYKKQGYEDVFNFISTFAPRESVHRYGHLRAERISSGKLHLADSLFQKVAAGNLGFAQRHKSFILMMVATGEIGEGEVTA
ncbi:MAG: GNAT family N-acetyltransferase [Chloroflexi bacterium]|nr:GNAT family N-acetyltransferase [Chloroflexota bacterium]